MATSITEYSEVDAQLAALTQRHANVVYDVASPKGMAEAKLARNEIRKWQQLLEDKRVEIKAPALQRCRDIDGEAKRIDGVLSKLRTPIQLAIDAETERTRAAEQHRIAAIMERVTRMSNMPLQMYGQDSVTIETVLNVISDTVIDDSFEEFQAQAETAQRDAVEILRTMLKSALVKEAEAAELKRQQAIVAAQQAEQKRIDDEREQREQESRDRIAKQEREAQDRIDAQAAAARKVLDEEARLDRIARDKIAAQEKAERDTAEKIEREQRERDEATAREIERQRVELLDADALLKTFVERYGHLKRYGAIKRLIEDYFMENFK